RDVVERRRVLRKVRHIEKPDGAFTVTSIHEQQIAIISAVIDIGDPVLHDDAIAEEEPHCSKDAMDRTCSIDAVQARVSSLDDAVIEYAILRLVALKDDAGVGIALDLNVSQAMVIILSSLLNRVRIPDNLHAIIALTV